MLRRRRVLGFALAAAVAVDAGVALAAQDLCQGLVQDKAAHAMTVLPKPPVGQTVKDPQFGTTIRRISGVAVSEGENAVIKPMYSTMPAWNADESKLILWHRGVGHELYDGRTYKFIRKVPISPTDVEQVLWDPTDPDVLYYPSNYNAVPDLMRYRVSKNATDVVKNFQGAPTRCPVDWGKLLRLGNDPQYMSWGPAKIVGLNCGDTKFLYDIGAGRVLGVKNFTTKNAPIATPTGNFAYLDGSVYDLQLNQVRSLTMYADDAWQHASLGRSSAGDVLAHVSFDAPSAQQGAVVVHELGTGARRVVVGPVTGWPYPPSGTHLSAVSHKAPGWVEASLTGDRGGRRALDQEIILVNVDTNKVCRVAHHRSVGRDGPWGYWAEPHGVISPTGTRILFASDWGGGPSVDAYVVELPSYGGSGTPDLSKPR
jgi:hypothetical protein